jgi:hypothetical protein
MMHCIVASAHALRTRGASVGVAHVVALVKLLCEMGEANERCSLIDQKNCYPGKCHALLPCETVLLCACLHLDGGTNRMPMSQRCCTHNIVGRHERIKTTAKIDRPRNFQSIDMLFVDI